MFQRWSAIACVCALSLGSACAVDSAPGSTQDTSNLSEADEALVLSFVNDPSTTEASLDDGAWLDRRAAANIIAHRDGYDALSRTDDDDRYDTFAELAAVSYVGPSALERIRDYALANPPPVPEEVEGVSFSGYEAQVVIAGVNQANIDELDVDVALDSRAAANLVAAAPFAKVSEMAAVAFVSASALSKLRAHVSEWGSVSMTTELGIVSDLDKTVIPPAEPDLSKAPYPGVRLLFEILERRSNGADGDLHYVTARTPDLVSSIPEYFEEHGIPTGSIDTGVSGMPWLAEPEKVADVSAVLNAAGEQRFILFGDSSHVDPAVYQTIRANYPDRIIAGFIHKVNNTVSPDRVEGLHLHEGYAEVAALLYGYEVLTRNEAHAVMRSARDEGLAITEAEMDVLLDEHMP
jgi:hypothetical protein